MDAADWVSSSIAAVAAAAGIAALVVAVLSYNRSKDSVEQAKRSADQAERSADHAGEAVVEARRSADEAARMRELDEGRRGEEKERWHREREPQLPGEIRAKLRRQGNGDAGALYGEITVPSVYRVRADAVSGQASTQVALDGVTKANQPMTFVIERWAPGKTKPDTDEIVFQFWPPVVGVDGAVVWACNCGRPVNASADEPAHWERRVRVKYSRPRMTSV